MEEKDEWVFFEEIEWNDPKFNVFSVDTRDFHCGYRFEPRPHKDLQTLKKYPHFFHTEEEIKTLVKRYFEESGGIKKWRFFSIDGIADWSFKYIRIWRTEFGFIVCNSDNRAFKKEILNNKITKELL